MNIINPLSSSGGTSPQSAVPESATSTSPSSISEVPHVPADSALNIAWGKRAGYLRALLGIFGATLIALGTLFDTYGLIFPIAIISAVLIAGWPYSLGLPSKRIPRVMLAILAVALIIAAAFGTLAHTAIVAAVSVVAAFFVEMLRGDGRPRLVEELSGNYAGAIILMSGSLWIHALRADGGKPVVLVGAATVAIVAIIHAFDSTAAHVIGMINALASAAVFGYIFNLYPESIVILGLAIGAIYLLVARLSLERPKPMPLISEATRAMVPVLGAGVAVFIAVSF